MRVGLLRQREDFDAVLCATLEAGWKEQYGHPFEVRRDTGGTGQRWRLQALLDGYYTDDCAAAPAGFLRDSFRYGESLLRAVPQWLLGTALATGPALRHLSEPGLRVNPPVPNAASLLIVPGNQRIRIYDFARKRSRVLLKQGFSKHTMEREIELRASGIEGPFIRILKHAPDATWFEESIIDGFCLPRRPLWLRRSRHLRDAFHKLDLFTQNSIELVSAASLAEALATELTTLATELRARFSSAPEFGPWLELLVLHGSQLGETTTGLTHGDMQPGNVMVGRDGSVTIIDWEHHRRRFSLYDRMVFGLESRRPVGIGTRLKEFATGAPLAFPLSELPPAPEWRRSAAALFVLEDLAFFARESLTGPFRSASPSLARYTQELARTSKDIFGDGAKAR